MEPNFLDSLRRDQSLFEEARKQKQKNQKDKKRKQGENKKNKRNAGEEDTRNAQGAVVTFEGSMTKEDEEKIEKILQRYGNLGGFDNGKSSLGKRSNSELSEKSQKDKNTRTDNAGESFKKKSGNKKEESSESLEGKPKKKINKNEDSLSLVANSLENESTKISRGDDSLVSRSDSKVQEGSFTQKVDEKRRKRNTSKPKSEKIKMELRPRKKPKKEKSFFGKNDNERRSKRDFLKAKGISTAPLNRNSQEIDEIDAASFESADLDMESGINYSKLDKEMLIGGEKYSGSSFAFQIQNIRLLSYELEEEFHPSCQIKISFENDEMIRRSTEEGQSAIEEHFYKMIKKEKEAKGEAWRLEIEESQKDESQKAKNEEEWSMSQKSTKKFVENGSNEENGKESCFNQKINESPKENPEKEMKGRMEGGMEEPKELKGNSNVKGSRRKTQKKLKSEKKGKKRKECFDGEAQEKKKNKKGKTQRRTGKSAQKELKTKGKPKEPKIVSNGKSEVASRKSSGVDLDFGWNPMEEQLDTRQFPDDSDVDIELKFEVEKRKEEEEWLPEEPKTADKPKKHEASAIFVETAFEMLGQTTLDLHLNEKEVNVPLPPNGKDSQNNGKEKESSSKETLIGTKEKSEEVHGEKENEAASLEKPKSKRRPSKKRIKTISTKKPKEKLVDEEPPTKEDSKGLLAKRKSKKEPKGPKSQKRNDHISKLIESYFEKHRNTQE